MDEIMIVILGVSAFIIGLLIGYAGYQYKLTPDVYDSQYELCKSNDGIKHIHINGADTYTVCNNGAKFVIETKNAD